MAFLQIAALAVVLALCYAILRKYFSTEQTPNPAPNIPGLKPSDKEYGNSKDIAKAGSFHEFLMDLHRKYGPIASFYMGKRRVVSTASPSLFKQYAHVFDRPSELFELFIPVVGSKNIQFANGQEGRARRRLHDTCFAHGAVCNMIPTFQKLSEELATRWDAASSEEEHIPVYEECMSFAIQAIITTSYGKLFERHEDFVEMKSLYNYVWTEMEERIKGYSPSPGSSHGKQIEHGIAEFHNAFYKAIENRKRNPPGEDEEKLFIDVLMSSGASDEVVRQDWISYCIGGFHTSGTLLTWCVYFLATHPDIQEKLHGELQEVLGEEPVAPSIVAELKYMRQVLDETMRCSVLAPWAARFQQEDAQLDGYLIPKNTPVIQALGVVLMDESIWPNPRKFVPDRFTEENKRGRVPYSFEPFGFGGTRKCPGYRLAYMEVTVALSVLVRKFRFHCVDGQTIEPYHGLVTRPKHEIWITAERRE